MTRRAMTPAERAQAEAQDEASRKEARRLKRQGVHVVTDQAKRLVHAQRQDVFDMLHARRRITDQSLAAVRRLEADMALSAGVREGGETVKVDMAPTARGVDDERIDASTRILGVRRRTPERVWALLAALLQPQFAGETLTNWRTAVQRVTRTSNPAVQSDRVIVAAETLEGGWRLYDRDAPKRSVDNSTKVA